MRTCRAAPAALTAADRFLARYVTSDGRVIRHDQGGDIVSEGQAYAMLIAELAARPALVRTIWSWTAERLGNSDGLLASHASGNGQVDDPHSATDADVLIAYALLRYTGRGQRALRREGRRIANAVLSEESVTLPDGAPLLVAGPWAKATKTVDPSYLMPSVFAAIGGLTGDDRWQRAADASIRIVGGLTDGGRQLPPDWGRLMGDRVVPIAHPGGGAGVQYGFDAARLPIWFATACTAGARSLAAGWWRNVLGSRGRAGPQALGLDGSTIDAAPSPLPQLAGAAAATAAGDRIAARRLRASATTLALEDPTYYGGAWAALGPALLDGSIGPCAEAVARPN
ncbi:MAG TPA: glycosyl hydrolase family 8 [Solirubrobacteraceae bacterium]|nr:glycosyl hydrolase family 8 [Solirubrobacteraceae bacterium]